MKHIAICLISAVCTLGAASAPAWSQASTEAVHGPALTPPPPAGGSGVDIAVWRASYVDEKGALPIGATDSAIEYGVAGSFGLTPSGTLRGWVRWERFTPTKDEDGVTRSFSQLLEVDCLNGRARMLAVDLYPYNNLQGSARHMDAQAPAWSYSRPGTVLEQDVGVFCSAARSAVTQAAAAQTTVAQGRPAAPFAGHTVSSSMTPVIAPQ